MPYFPDDRPIIVFDGHCALCSGFARFVLRHDRAGLFRLLPAQTRLGTALYEHYGLDPVKLESNILLECGRAFLKSEGSIRMAERLGAPRALVGALRALPLPIRDGLYEMLARSRFWVGGRLTSCLLTEPGHEDRFLS